MLNRISSRNKPEHQSFLQKRLDGAVRYCRIAGYFSSSILEVAGEALEKLPEGAKVVCNSHYPEAQLLRDWKGCIKSEWQARWGLTAEPGEKARFQRLVDLIAAKKLHVKVLPDDAFGMIHGKAGVIDYADGKATSFLGSTNETWQAWCQNYELMWEDDSAESRAWVLEEFDALWNHPHAKDLLDFPFIVGEITRLANAKTISREDWENAPDADGVVTALPVYRKDDGLWPWQQWFIGRAFQAHLGRGARFLLADHVGLGKTIQLGTACLLAVIKDEKPGIIVVPKTLMEQWQDELWDKLAMPNARWDSAQKVWITEDKQELPLPFDRCPRLIGIISQGLVTQSEEYRDILLNRTGNYSCVVVDESHRARTSRTQGGTVKEHNKLMTFLRAVSGKTKSMLLGTATPVQLNQVELFDLLAALDGESEVVLGNANSLWRNRIPEGLDIVAGTLRPNGDERFDWLRNPFPQAWTHEDIANIRRRWALGDKAVIPAEVVAEKKSDHMLVRYSNHLNDLNPYVIHVVQRTRKDLEQEGILPRIEVGPSNTGPEELCIPTSSAVEQAFGLAEEFCDHYGQRTKCGRFMQTMLLRRIGSSLLAGLATTRKLLAKGMDDSEEEGEEEQQSEKLADPSAGEWQILTELSNVLEGELDGDPKFQEVMRLLEDRAWDTEGCILFSQYYDTARTFAENYSRRTGRSVGLYAGGSKSGIISAGVFRMEDRGKVKWMIQNGELLVLFGTDAAAEGLNLQSLKSLINIDMPWNPTRLEQRLGRIRRIGQVHTCVQAANLRYAGSVEDRVHQKLSARFAEIREIFGTLPDSLRDAWVDIALGQEEAALKRINDIPKENPFRERYAINKLEDAGVSWGFAKETLTQQAIGESLRRGW